MATSMIGRWRYWLALLVILALAGTVGFISLASAAGPKGCTNATVKGEYGFVQSGVAFPGGVRTDWAVVGRVVFDGKGSVEVTKATVGIGGNIVKLTGSGSYAVNPDCTGTLESTYSNGQTNHRDIVIVDGGREIFGISTDPGWVTTGHVVRIGSED